MEDAATFAFLERRHQGNRHARLLQGVTQFQGQLTKLAMFQQKKRSDKNHTRMVDSGFVLTWQPL